MLDDGATWRCVISRRALPFDDSCTRYLDVVIRERRLDGYETGEETCTDGSVGRDLPTR